MEMRRIRKAKEQAIQILQEKKSRLKAECEKERDEICKKYDILFQHDEMVLTQKKKDFETHYKKVYVNKLLAETFRQGYECDKVGLSGIYKKEFNSSRPLLVSCDLKIARNITTNESMNAVRYAYLRTPDGQFRNPYNRGCRKNCADFLIVGNTDDDDETPWPSLQQVAQ